MNIWKVLMHCTANKCALIVFIANNITTVLLFEARLRSDWGEDIPRWPVVLMAVALS